MVPLRTIVLGAFCVAEVVEVGMWGVVVAGGGRRCRESVKEGVDGWGVLKYISGGNEMSSRRGPCS